MTTLTDLLEKEKSEDETLIESLAAIEHEQWIEWASALIKSEKLSPERVARWKKLFIPYNELSEESKEQDRVYARKVIKAFK